MIKINLLPREARQHDLPVGRLLMLIGVLLFIITSSTYGYNLYKISSMERQLQDISNQYQLLQSTQEIMRSANNKQQLIDKKNHVLVLVDNGRKSWYAIMKNLATIAPLQIWFTDVAIADKGMIRIRGNALNYPAIAEFMSKLEQNQFFIEPNLIGAEQDTISKNTKFEIMVKTKGMQ